MASSSSSSSSTSKVWKYDVFLSFRGEDTRKTFVDHLYSALEHHGIVTYKDDVTLDRGDTIGPSLLKAIESSQILVIIFSENYADSSWCLDELSHIMKCRDSETGQIVLPIFYHVDPSDVRKQKGIYGEAFAKHELSENGKKKVESWKKALFDAGNISGWEPNHVANGHEAKCVKNIVDSILDKLQSLNSAVEDEELVGMATRLKDLKSHLRIGSGGVRMVGIWGVGGGGKTTLATSLYMEISAEFDGCCFVENVREASKQQNGLKSLQEKILSTVFNKEMKFESVELGKHGIKRMLCRRNVLIVLDDVDRLEQLQALAGYHNWFGNGSRIIITTRDEHVLKSHRVDDVCPVSLLSRDEAIQLFKKHAYQEQNPVEDYKQLSLRVISYVNGLPLALKILGAFLYEKDKDEWLSTLDRLKYHPEMDIVGKLKISYDGLKDVEKELFLDIACFYRGKSKDDAMEKFDACGFYPVIGVKVLTQKALITVSEDGEFDMHDLVQEMAHYIVRGEHPNNPEKHSRVWRLEDIEYICSRNATTENDNIEAIQCHTIRCSINFIMLISNMKKLRFLQAKLFGETSIDDAPSFLSNELRYLDWEGYPASPFPESFQPRKLVILRMGYSLQKELWKGYKYLPCLKAMELYGMELVRTPDISGLPCLQKLTVEKCESLEEIHQSLGNHNSLVNVCVKDCEKLRRFPSIVRMEKLKILDISKCKALIEFLKIEAKMNSLVREVGIEVLPSTIGEHCTNLTSLELSHCSLEDGVIPKGVGELSNLQELDLSGNDFTRLDFSLSRLTSLKLLELNWCTNLVELPELPPSLVVLRADCCKSLKSIVRDDIHINCKCLCDVSIIKSGGSNPIGGERLLETMIQGVAVESSCMALRINYRSEIARVFEPCVVGGRKRCIMELPENWYNECSGFLFFTASRYYDEYYSVPSISMKHVGDDVCWEEEETVYNDIMMRRSRLWVGYLPFSLLGDTSWWDPTSTALEVDFHMNEYSNFRIRKCGWKLVPKGGAASDAAECSETTPTTHSSDDDDDYYKCKLHIEHDSKSAIKFQIHGRRWW